MISVCRLIAHLSHMTIHSDMCPNRWAI